MKAKQAIKILRNNGITVRACCDFEGLLELQIEGGRSIRETKNGSFNVLTKEWKTIKTDSFESAVETIKKDFTGDLYE